MSDSRANRIQLVRDSYANWQSGDRDAQERLLADGYTFSAPPDPMLDRAGYLERCWPHHGTTLDFRFLRLAEVGEEVLVTYQAARADGQRFQNTEIFGFDGDQIARTEVYFGWELPSPRDR